MIFREQHEATANVVKAIVKITMSMPKDDLEALRTHYDRFEAFGSFIDPTGWMQSIKQEQLDHRIVRAVSKFRNELEEIKTDVEAQP